MAKALIVEILGNATQFAHELDKAAGKTRQFSKAAGVAGVALAGTLALGLERSVKAAMNAQVSQQQLERALKNTGQSFAAAKGPIDDAETAARKLGFTDDDVRTSLARLETATGSTKKSITDLSVAQDLARFKGIGLTDATQTLAMAMAGSQRAAHQLGIVVPAVTKNYDALKASGADLTTETGKLAEAHAKLLDKMATGQAVIDATSAKVKGQAATFADTAAGGMAQFHAELNHLEVSIGDGLLPALTTVTTFLAQHVIPGIGAGIDYVKAHWPEIQAVIDKVWQAIKPTMEALKNAVVGIADAVQQHWPLIQTILAQVWTIARPILDELKTALQLVADLLHGNWSAAWHDAVNIVRDQFEILKNTVTAGATDIKNLMMAGIRPLVGAIKNDVIDPIVNFFSELPGRVADAVKGDADVLWNGVKHIFDKLPGFVKDVLGISSPSKVFMEIGEAIVHGAIKGIENKAGDLVNAATGVAGKLVNSVGGAIGGAASSVAGAVGGFVGGLFGGGGGSPGTSGGLSGTRALGQQMAARYGWGSFAEWSALDALWTRESGWNPYARNASSGAFGIPQALPPSKMPLAAQRGDAGSQIAWGLDYIKGRYGDPLNAWAHEQAVGWYASGGIFNRPTVIGVGEAGPEAVVPLKKLGGNEYHFHFPQYQGDKRELAQTVRAEFVKMTRNGSKLGFAGA